MSEYAVIPSDVDIRYKEGIVYTNVNSDHLLSNQETTNKGIGMILGNAAGIRYFVSRIEMSLKIPQSDYIMINGKKIKRHVKEKYDGNEYN